MNIYNYNIFLDLFCCQTIFKISTAWQNGRGVRNIKMHFFEGENSFPSCFMVFTVVLTSFCKIHVWPWGLLLTNYNCLEFHPFEKTCHTWTSLIRSKWSNLIIKSTQFSYTIYIHYYCSEHDHKCVFSFFWCNCFPARAKMVLK